MGMLCLFLLFCSKKIVTRLLKPFVDSLAERDVVLKEGTILSRISKAKSRGLTPQEFIDECAATTAVSKRPMGSHSPSQIVEEVVGKIYEQYQLVLKRSNSLDFDDLLVYGVKLFRDNPKASRWCQHILVDELCVITCLASAYMLIRRWQPRY